MTHAQTEQFRNSAPSVLQPPRLNKEHHTRHDRSGSFGLPEPGRLNDHAALGTQPALQSSMAKHLHTMTKSAHCDPATSRASPQSHNSGAELGCCCTRRTAVVQRAQLSSLATRRPQGTPPAPGGTVLVGATKRLMSDRWAGPGGRPVFIMSRSCSVLPPGAAQRSATMWCCSTYTPVSHK